MEASGDEEDVLGEIEVLESIYINELTVEKDESGRPAHVELLLHPATAEDAEKQYVCLTLDIFLPKKYPVVLPEICIKNPRGLADEHINELRNKLLKECEDKVGECMLFGIIEMTKESLTQSNVPHGKCAICQEQFFETDSYQKTECYHYFHNYPCLFRYIEHELEAIKQEKFEQKKIRHLEKEERQVVCPVCRKPITYNLESLSNVQTVKEEAIVYTPTEEMCLLQKKMSLQYAAQKQKGGIIDIEENRKKYLLPQSASANCLNTTTNPCTDDFSIQEFGTSDRLIPETYGGKGRGMGSRRNSSYNPRTDRGQYKQQKVISTYFQQKRGDSLSRRSDDLTKKPQTLMSSSINTITQSNRTKSNLSPSDGKIFSCLKVVNDPHQRNRKNRSDSPTLMFETKRSEHFHQSHKDKVYRNVYKDDSSDNSCSSSIENNYENNTGTLIKDVRGNLNHDCEHSSCNNISRVGFTQLSQVCNMVNTNDGNLSEQEFRVNNKDANDDVAINFNTGNDKLNNSCDFSCSKKLDCNINHVKFTIGDCDTKEKQDLITLDTGMSIGSNKGKYIMKTFSNDEFKFDGGGQRNTISENRDCFIGKKECKYNGNRKNEIARNSPGKYKADKDCYHTSGNWFGLEKHETVAVANTFDITDSTKTIKSNFCSKNKRNDDKNKDYNLADDSASVSVEDLTLINVSDVSNQCIGPLCGQNDNQFNHTAVGSSFIGEKDKLLTLTGSNPSIESPNECLVKKPHGHNSNRIDTKSTGSFASNNERHSKEKVSKMTDRVYSIDTDQCREKLRNSENSHNHDNSHSKSRDRRRGENYYHYNDKDVSDKNQRNYGNSHRNYYDYDYPHRSKRQQQPNNKSSDKNPKYDRLNDSGHCGENVKSFEKTKEGKLSQDNGPRSKQDIVQKCYTPKQQPHIESVTRGITKEKYRDDRKLAITTSKNETAASSFSKKQAVDENDSQATNNTSQNQRGLSCGEDKSDKYGVPKKAREKFSGREKEKRENYKHVTDKQGVSQSIINRPNNKYHKDSEAGFASSCESNVLTGERTMLKSKNDAEKTRGSSHIYCKETQVFATDSTRKERTSKQDGWKDNPIKSNYKNCDVVSNQAAEGRDKTSYHKKSNGIRKYSGKRYHQTDNHKNNKSDNQKDGDFKPKQEKQSTTTKSDCDTAEYRFSTRKNNSHNNDECDTNNLSTPPGFKCKSGTNPPPGFKSLPERTNNDIVYNSNTLSNIKPPPGFS